MTHAGASPGRRIVLLACLGLTASLISPLGGALRTGATAATAAVTAASTAATTPPVAAAPAPLTAASPPSAAHPFSDPIWSPFRDPARVNCVRTNCPGPYHGYWAIDFVDPDKSTFDPIYAAGAGIFHIGKVMGKDTCIAPGAADSTGTWVWIDHGGSRTTMYTHLYAVLASEGQLVTPATMIGRMGHNGNKAPCTANYLHMEYRVHGVGGTRVPPNVMLACTANGRVSMPSSLGYASWDLVPTNQDPKRGLKPNVYTPTATNSCLAASRGADTPNRPVVTGARGPASATVRWGVVPLGVNHTLVTIEQWHPSLGKYGQPVNRTVAGTTSSTRFTGLLNGRPYRFRVATHNGAGYSAWSPYVKVTPGRATPLAPRAPRALTTTRTSIRYAWWLPAKSGTAITRFQVARRCLVRGSWTRWAYTKVPAHVQSTSWNLHYNWTGMPRGRTCQVTVRATNSAGSGPWSTRSLATTRR